MTRPNTKTATLIDTIKRLGTVRTQPLSEATDIPANSIQGLLATAEKHGEVISCKVTVPGERSQRQYRMGPGQPPGGMTPLKAHKGAATGAARHRPTQAGAPPPNTLQHSQPAVEKNTGSTRPDMPPATPFAGARAVAAKTPERPAAPARDVAPGALRCSLGSDGVLDIIMPADDGARLQLNPAQVLHLGDYLHATQGVWRP